MNPMAFIACMVNWSVHVDGIRRLSSPATPPAATIVRCVLTNAGLVIKFSAHLLYHSTARPRTFRSSCDGMICGCTIEKCADCLRWHRKECNVYTRAAMHGTAEDAMRHRHFLNRHPTRQEQLERLCLLLLVLRQQ